MIGIVIDIETSDWYKENPNTGTLEDSSEILEIGYIRVDMNNGKIIDCGELYFYKPYFQVESSAQKVHGIQRSFLEQYEGDFRKDFLQVNGILKGVVRHVLAGICLDIGIHCLPCYIQLLAGMLP